MQDLRGNDIGDVIPFRPESFSEPIPHPVRHPWPRATAVSAGRGVVFSRGTSETYETMFIEVYPPGAAFIRGEGETLAECEDAAWAQFVKACSCPGPTGEHEWEPRGYRNGAGFCRHCDTFGVDKFTPEELGQYCRECGAATKWSWETDKVTGEVTFICEDCKPPRTYGLLASDDPEDTPEAFTEALFEVLGGIVWKETEEDPGKK